MRIIEDVKLDFNDVLINQTFYTYNQKDANLTRRFTFRHSKNDWTGKINHCRKHGYTGTYEMHTDMSMIC